MEKITLPKDFKFRPGRPIRIIRHKLEVLKGKDYARCYVLLLMQGFY